eukprot:2989087-Prymnesium_polylepis.1
MQCFFWHGGVRVALRVVFGGAHGPERFCSGGQLPAPDRRAPDRRPPAPTPAASRCHRTLCGPRSDAGAVTAVRAGVEQTRPWFIQAYLDDTNLSGLDY